MSLNDIDHWYSNDIGVSPSGDLGAVTGLTRGQQRVLRRLLTNPREVTPDGDVLPADYIWHPGYGGGLARFIGQTDRRYDVIARIRSQMNEEACVAKSPAPVIDVKFLPNGLTVNLRYTDVDNGQTTLSFNVNQ